MNKQIDFTGEYAIRGCDLLSYLSDRIPADVKEILNATGQAGVYRLQVREGQLAKSACVYFRYTPAPGEERREIFITTIPFSTPEAQLAAAAPGRQLERGCKKRRPRSRRGPAGSGYRRPAAGDRSGVRKAKKR